MSSTTRLESQDRLGQVVRRFGRFRKRWQVLDALARCVLIGPGLLAVWAVLDALFGLPAWPLVVGFALVVLAAAWALVWLLVRRLWRRPEPEQEALVIESLHGGLDNRLIGAMQLADDVFRAEQSSRPLSYSADFVRLLVVRTAAELQHSRPERLIDLRSTRRLLSAASILAGAIIATVVLAPGFVAERWSRLDDAYAAVLDSLFPVELQVTPGNTAVVRGRPLELAVNVVGARRRQVKLVRAIETAPTDTTEAAAEPEESLLDLSDSQQAKFSIAAIQQSFNYYFEYAGRRSEEFRVDVADLPELQAINYELVFPAYTGQPPRTLVGRVPRLDGLSGTGVLVSFAASTPLAPDRCYAQWQDGTRQGVAVSGRYGHFSFTIDRPQRVEIHLTGHFGAGFEMAEPIRFEVNVEADQPPVVAAQLKNRKLSLLAEEASLFGVAWTAEDDFGVDEVQLEYRIDTIDALLGRPTRQGSLAQRIEPPRDRVKGVFATIFKDLSPALEPGDRITLTLAARDNNTETGPSLGKSLPIEIVVVRPDLAAFLEQKLALGGDEALLGGLQRIKRSTDLLVDPQRTVRTQSKLAVESQAVKSRINQESWPSGSEDAVGDYFRLLSGEK